MSKLEVDAIEPQSGTTLTLGASGDSVDIASGATITNFTSTGIDDNATSTAITINSSGSVTKPNQPAFLAYVTPSVQNNIANDDEVTFNNESFDLQSNFASNIFTAPVTGKYQFDFIVSVTQLDYNATLNRIRMATSNKAYFFGITSQQMFNGADPTYFSFQGSLLVDMDAGDTCKLQWSQSGGTAQADVFDSTYFSGYLVC